MTDIVFELDRFSDLISCEVVPISIELVVASNVAMLKVSLVCDLVVSCVWVDRSITGSVDCLSVEVLVYSLLTSVDWSSVDERVAEMVIIA